MHARAAAGVGRQRARHQRRAEMRAADANVYDVGDFFAAAAGDRAGAHAIGEFAHAGEGRLHLRQYIDAVNQ